MVKPIAIKKEIVDSVLGKRKRNQNPKYAEDDDEFVVDSKHNKIQKLEVEQ